MADEPMYASDYTPEDFKLIKRELLYVATVVGDDLMEDVVVIGGLVPSLLIAAPGDEVDFEPHVGTKDLDIGLKVAMLETKRYQELAKRLRQAGFVQDVNERGNPIRQRWCFPGLEKATVEFLIPPSRKGDKGGDVRDIEKDFAAIIVPGLLLAFKDRVEVEVNGLTLKNEQATRSVWVCGPGAFVILKALASQNRRKTKDAYDLFYMVSQYGDGPESVAEKLKPLLGSPAGKAAVDFLRLNFLAHDGLGPVRVAEFLTGEPNDDKQQDVVGVVRLLLRHCGIEMD